MCLRSARAEAVECWTDMRQISAESDRLTGANDIRSGRRFASSGPIPEASAGRCHNSFVEPLLTRIWVNRWRLVSGPGYRARGRAMNYVYLSAGSQSRPLWKRVRGVAGVGVVDLLRRGPFESRTLAGGKKNATETAFYMIKVSNRMSIPVQSIELFSRLYGRI